MENHHSNAPDAATIEEVRAIASWLGWENLELISHDLPSDDDSEESSRTSHIFTADGVSDDITLLIAGSPINQFQVFQGQVVVWDSGVITGHRVFPPLPFSSWPVEHRMRIKEFLHFRNFESEEAVTGFVERHPECGGFDSYEAFRWRDHPGDFQLWCPDVRLQCLHAELRAMLVCESLGLRSSEENHEIAMRIKTAIEWNSPSLDAYLAGTHKQLFTDLDLEATPVNFDDAHAVASVVYGLEFSEQSDVQAALRGLDRFLESTTLDTSFEELFLIVRRELEALLHCIDDMDEMPESWHDANLKLLKAICGR